MKTNFSLLFYLKKPKNYLKGAVPVYLRINVDGKPVEMSASRKCELELWNAKAGHIIGTKEDSKIISLGLKSHIFIGEKIAMHMLVLS